MAAREDLINKIQLIVESQGLDLETQKIRTQEQAWDQLTTVMVKHYRTLELNQARFGGIVTKPLVEQQMGGAPTGGLPTMVGGGDIGGKKDGDDVRNLGDAYQEGFSKVQAFTGAMSNLVHMYYWAENAVLQLENAQNRLANAQDRYNRALREYGAGSWQAIRSYRQMQVAENRLERAHNREILNYGLLGTQMVMMVGNLAKLTSGLWAKVAVTAADTVQTSLNTQANTANAMSRLAMLAANPLTWVAAAVAGAMVFGFLNRRAGEEFGRREERRMEGIPEAQGGAIIQRPGLLYAHQDEIILNRNQQGGMGGAQITVGGVTIVVGDRDLEGIVDEGYDRQKGLVKNSLRRLLR